MLGEPSAAFGDEAVFLQADGGFFGDGKRGINY
jgi:hypothetical protein